MKKRASLNKAERKHPERLPANVQCRVHKRKNRNSQLTWTNLIAFNAALTSPL